MQVTRRPIAVSIALPGVSAPQLLRVTSDCEFVGDVTGALIAIFKQLEGIKPDQVRLFKLGDEDSSRVLLDSSQTLSEAGICTGTKLAVVII